MWRGGMGEERRGWEERGGEGTVCTAQGMCISRTEGRVECKEAWELHVG